MYKLDWRKSQMVDSMDTFREAQLQILLYFGHIIEKIYNYFISHFHPFKILFQSQLGWVTINLFLIFYDFETACFDYEIKFNVFLDMIKFTLK
jgi:hypothetical protein